MRSPCRSPLQAGNTLAVNRLHYTISDYYKATYVGLLESCESHWTVEWKLERHHDIRAIKYFTARVSETPADQSKPQRQDVYFRALSRYRPQVAFHFGHFLSHRVRAPLAQPVRGRRTVEVIRTEEKGSDVNLAVHLLNDGWLNVYDCAVVVSNDSDLAEAMRLVREQRGKRIGLVTPGTGKPSHQLRMYADFARHIRPNGLRKSQLPDPIPGTNIRKPATW